MAENNNIYGDTEAVYIIILVYRVSMDRREVINKNYVYAST